MTQRRTSIGLIIGGSLLIAVPWVYNFFGLYSLVGQCSDHDCDTVLRAYSMRVVLGKICMAIGLGLLIGGIVLFRKSEGKNNKPPTKNKLWY